MCNNEGAINPAICENNAAFGDLNISRIAPEDGGFSIDWIFNPRLPEGNFKFAIYWAERTEQICEPGLEADGDVNTFTVSGLSNGMDYQVYIAAVEAGSCKEYARSRVRLVRPGKAPGIVVNYLHPEDYTYDSSGRSLASPSLVRLPNGGLLAAHDVYWCNGGQNLTKVFHSVDQGKSWRYLSDVFPCFWGKLFVHKDKLYMLGTSTEYGALSIFRSDDWGKSWSRPSIIMKGGSMSAGGPHKAPMPVINYYGRLWTAIDYGSWSIGGHASGVVSAEVDDDLMEPQSWTVTPFLPYNDKWPGTVEGKSHGLLEGNVVVSPEGGLVNFLRYSTGGCRPDYGRAIMLNADRDNPAAPLSFRKVVDFHGNMSKFSIHYDEKTKKYWSLVNRVTTKWVTQRNILTLVSSPDLENWKIEKDVLNYQDIGWPEGYKLVGFQYVDWIFDGDDILYLSRTAINGAHNFHDANYITFHRIENYGSER